MLLAALFALTNPANAANYEVDATHSHIGFSVVHMTISNVRGEFGTVAGTVAYDDKNPTAMTLSASITVSSIDTRDTSRNEHLLSADFFDVAKYPNMSFVSKSVKATTTPTAGFDVTGDLTLHGVTKSVVLHVDPFTAEIKDPKGNIRRAAHATATLNRQDFGMNFNKTLDAGGLVVSDEVQVELDVEMKRLP